MFLIHYSRTSPEKPVNIDSAGVIRNLMPFGTPDRSGCYRTERLTAVQCVNWNTARSKLEPAPFIHTPTQIAVAAWARIDNRDELAAKLDLPLPEMDHLCDSELILRAYLRWQEDCVDHLVGDFVFALHDPKRQKIFCARDHMGVRPFYYFLSDERFVCATSIRPLQEIEGLSLTISRQWIVDYLTKLSMSFDRTPYEQIKKLPPAHCLTVTPERNRLRQYFAFSTEPELRLRDSREYVDAYREQLEIAVKCRLDTIYALGSELSGGIDSSTITAFAARFLAQPLSHFHTFAFATSELEPQYILAVSQAFGLPFNHVLGIRKWDYNIFIGRPLAVLGYPAEHGNAMSHEPFYRLAEKFSVRTLLSGFGGDEFVTTIHGYLVPMGLIMQGRYRDLYNILPGNAVLRFLRLVKLGIKKRQSKGFSLPEYAPRFLDAFRKRWPYMITRPELVEEYNLKERYFDGAKFDAGYTDLKRFTLENRWAPFVATRLTDCTLMAAARKIEYRWPLLDIRLVRLFLRIPSEENYFRGMGRYLHRRAIAGVVPDLITWKKGKSMGNMVIRDFWETGEEENFSASEIHPALTEVIDAQKLERQVQELAQASNKQDLNRLVTIRQSVSAVRALSAWLREDFRADGAGSDQSECSARV